MESKSGMRFEGEFIFEQRFHNLIQKEQQQFDSMVRYILIRYSVIFCNSFSFIVILGNKLDFSLHS